MTDAGSEFVTIAEAARRLGISERQAHRDAKRLSDDDRHRPPRGAVRVRLSALAALREEVTVEESDSGRHAADNGRHTADTRDELIEQLRSEVAFLRETVRQEQAAHQDALRALRSEQDRTAQLEHLQTRLIEALPAPTSGRVAPDNGRHEADSGRQAAPSPETGNQPAESVPGAPVVTEPAPMVTPTGVSSATMETRRVFDAGKPQERPRWWRRLFGLRG